MTRSSEEAMKLTNPTQAMELVGVSAPLGGE
jgi:hypothetical protein